MLNNSVLEDKGRVVVKKVQEGVFGGTCFRDIYSIVNGK